MTEYLTEPQAAKLAGVVHETINNWGESGKIRVITDPAALLRFNANKPGRPSSRLYVREDIEKMVETKRQSPPPEDIDDWWTVREIASEVLRPTRAVYYMIKALEAQTWRSESGKVYVSPDSAEAVMDRLAPLSEAE